MILTFPITGYLPDKVWQVCAHQYDPQCNQNNGRRNDCQHPENSIYEPLRDFLGCLHSQHEQIQCFPQANLQSTTESSTIMACYVHQRKNNIQEVMKLVILLNYKCLVYTYINTSAL